MKDETSGQKIPCRPLPTTRGSLLDGLCQTVDGYPAISLRSNRDPWGELSGCGRLGRGRRPGGVRGRPVWRPGSEGRFVSGRRVLSRRSRCRGGGLPAGPLAFHRGPRKPSRSDRGDLPRTIPGRLSARGDPTGSRPGSAGFFGSTDRARLSRHPSRPGWPSGRRILARQTAAVGRRARHSALARSRRGRSTWWPAGWPNLAAAAHRAIVVCRLPPDAGGRPPARPDATVYRPALVRSRALCLFRLDHRRPASRQFSAGPAAAAAR